MKDVVNILPYTASGAPFVCIGGLPGIKIFIGSAYMYCTGSKGGSLIVVMVISVFI